MLRARNKLKTLHQPVKKTGPVTTQQVVGLTEIAGGIGAVVYESTQTITEGHGLYVLLQDCVFLEEGTVGVQCMAYEDRPGICRDYEEGGPACLDGRAITAQNGRFPDWQPVELSTKSKVV
jgi:Fe-S-cluster containining protein